MHSPVIFVSTIAHIQSLVDYLMLQQYNVAECKLLRAPQIYITWYFLHVYMLPVCGYQPHSLYNYTRLRVASY